MDNDVYSLIGGSIGAVETPIVWSLIAEHFLPTFELLPGHFLIACPAGACIGMLLTYPLRDHKAQGTMPVSAIWFLTTIFGWTGILLLPHFIWLLSGSTESAYKILLWLQLLSSCFLLVGMYRWRKRKHG